MWLLGQLTHFLSSLPDKKKIGLGHLKTTLVCFCFGFNAALPFFTSSDLAQKEAIHAIPNGQHRPGSGK